MKYRARLGVLVIAASAAACGDSPTGPSGAASRILQGQTISAIDGHSAAGVSVQVGRERAVTSDADGMFQVDVDNADEQSAVFSSNAIVERRTLMAGSSDDRVRVSLIPASFDLAAFDQFARTANSRLQRWTTRPRLVVIATVMDYRSSSEDSFPATSQQLTDDEANAMVAHLTEGLTLLTGGTFTSFQSTDIERPAAGTSVSVLRPGAIVVGRYNGVRSMALTIGYGRWAEQGNGAVTAGMMVLDADFDRSDSRRRLLRIHELGHALGYLHVTTRASIMNPSIGPEPTDFDRAAATIAFQRPPGNVAPDTDPGATSSRSPFSTTTRSRTVWSPPVF